MLSKQRQLTRLFRIRRALSDYAAQEKAARPMRTQSVCDEIKTMIAEFSDLQTDGGYTVPLSFQTRIINLQSLRAIGERVTRREYRILFS